MGELRDPNSAISSDEIEALKMNQGIINRMAENSGKMKKFYLTGCAALIALYKIDSDIQIWKILIVFLIMSVMLWYLDAKYLMLERQFRKHHNAIVNGEVTYLGQWDFNPSRYKVDGLYETMCSFSVCLYPISMLICVFLFIV